MAVVEVVGWRLEAVAGLVWGLGWRRWRRCGGVVGCWAKGRWRVAGTRAAEAPKYELWEPSAPAWLENLIWPPSPLPLSPRTPPAPPPALPPAGFRLAGLRGAPDAAALPAAGEAMSA